MDDQRWRTPAQALRVARRAAERLAADPRVRLVFVFGSSLDSDRDRSRDVDVAVLFDQPLSLDEFLRMRADLVAAAGAPIDLVCLNQAGVVLAHEVATTGRCLYAADDDAEVEFVTRAQTRYWDFQPYLAEQWRLLGERLEERRHGSPR